MSRPAFLGICALLAAAVVTLIVWRGTADRGDGLRRLLRPDDSAAKLDRAAEARIAAFCGDCHALPRPESFPRDRWHAGVRKGYEFYTRSGRTDLTMPPIEEAVAWYRARAPERVEFPKPPEAATPLRVRFNVEQLEWSADPRLRPAVSSLRWAALEENGTAVLLVCDMRGGRVATVDLSSGNREIGVLARLDFPCHAEPCDLDGDGRIDLVVADLGSFAANDHDRGRVVWLRRGEGRTYTIKVLTAGLGRVADARPADFDDDGDLDVVVAEFGHYRTGGIHLLRNTAPRGEAPRFEREPIDLRPGAIHVPVHDFDGDGRLDFAALLSQEYECVDLFMNQENGPFKLRGVWTAPDLTFGSSGMELVDFDQDGDIDILYTNGDVFDNQFATPWHGVGWLENLGELDFAHHRLTDLTGAYRALAGDLDGDGDVDVVATTWLAGQIKPPELRQTPLASVVILEQTAKGEFARHTLETGLAHHPAMELADFDGDGDLDFAVGSHAGLDAPDGPTGVPLTVWWNETTTAAGNAR